MMELYAVYLTCGEWCTIIDKLHDGDDFDPLAAKILDAIGTIIPIGPEKNTERPTCLTCLYHDACWVRAALPFCPHYIVRYHK